MTRTVDSWGRTAGANNISGALFPEGLLGSLTTDNLRQAQAAIRQYANDAEWFSFGTGTGDGSFSFISTTQLRVLGGRLTDVYHRGRRVRVTGVAVGTIHGTITASAINGADTDVTVDWDGDGVLRNESFTVELGAVSAAGSSLPGIVDHDFEVSGQLRGVSATLTNDLTVSGTTTLSGDFNLDSGFTVGGDLTVDGNTTSVGTASYRSVSTIDGPFTMFTSSRRFNATGAVINVPSSARRGLLRAYAAGGGGSSESSGGEVVEGGRGQEFRIRSSPSSALSITMPGGFGGGDPTDSGDGRNFPTSDSIEITGTAVIDQFTLIGMGSPGGQGAAGGISGHPGDFAEVFLNVTGLTTITNSGGNGGAGGSRSGSRDGGRAARAQFYIQFFR